jgi:PAS domain S-box-containing protein
MAGYRLRDLLDLKMLQKMADAHYHSVGIPIGVIDAIDGSVLVGSGWQDICIKFHRVNPIALQRCRESDNYIKDRLVVGEACKYKCKNGLWDIGMPIVVAGRHLATMFLGQFFYEGETPDREFFVGLAHEYGFDVEEYLGALDRVPVFSREKVDFILEYDKALVAFITDLAEQALQKIRADEKIRESERKFHAIFNNVYGFLGLLSPDGRILDANNTILKFHGAERADIVGKLFWESPTWTHSPELQDKVRLAVRRAANGEFVRFEAIAPAADEKLHNIDFSLKPVKDDAGKVVLLIPEARDITEIKRAEEALERRIVALTRPLDDAEGITFDELFKLEDLQRLQDDFANATGVASLITHPDGTPITAPSNFCRLCKEIIRKTEKGRLNCYRSDAAIGQSNAQGATIQPCMSGGLWDAGAGISVGGRHIANWLIGQVRDETQTEDKIRAYAREIGADEAATVEAFREVPAMSREKFERVAKMLFTLANQLSNTAYQNIQQARFITELKRAEEALREANEFLSLAQQSAGAGVWDWDIPSGRLNWSPELYRLFGLDPASGAPTFDNWRKVMHPEDRQAAKARINEAIREHKPLVNEYRIVKPSGEVVWINALGNTVYDERGEPLRMAGICLDVTSRKRSELELRETKELLSLFIKNSPIYSFIKEVTPTESRVLYASDNFEQMVGIKGADMAGKTMDELFPAEFAAKINADDWTVVSKGETLKLDEDLNGRNYTTIKSSLHQGDKTLLVGHTIDITERKRAEKALRESEEKYRSIVETTEEWIWEMDLAGHHRYTNPAVTSILGYRPEEFLDKSALSFLHEEDRRAVEAALPTLFAEKRGWKGWVLRWKHKDGTYRYLESNASPVIDASGRLVGYLGADRDITERKLAEETKSKLEAQLQQAHKMESVGRLAGGVAHDFNNMLGVILGHAELAIKRVDPTQPIHANLTEIRKAAERSASLTRQLLAFARKQTIAPILLDINEAVGGMIEMLRRLIGENIDLVWLPKPGVWPVKMDPAQIDQILANLCVNARDAIAGVGRITIETENRTIAEGYRNAYGDVSPGDYVMLAVSDDGSGMDQETLEKLFEPFFTTKGIGKGTGLGLATVYGIVRQNNGFIDVYGEPGKGSSFRICLPRHVGKSEQVVAQSSTKPTHLGRETILLVEDEPAILEMNMEILRSLGYTVLAASAPGEAIRLAREHAGEIDLLLTDVVMPEMNGRDLAKNLLSLYPEIKRLFMSGYTADVIAHHGVLDEGVNFIQKPFTINELGAKVRAVLEGNG